MKKTQRDAVGVIVGDRRRLGGESWYAVQFGANTENVLEEELERFGGETDVVSLLKAGLFGSSAALARRMTMSKLRRPLRDAIYSLDASRTEFHPYQFKPLLKFLSSDRPRILIADEVGLGKTIEAGYILQEQKARYDIDRILIVCPASLRTKWQVEMSRRFGEVFEVFDSRTFRGRVSAREDGTPQRLQGIISLQSLRSDAVLDLLEQRPVQLDLLVVDEAHHCRNSDTKQHRAVRALTFAAESVAFLTATPLHLRNDDLFNLLRLLMPEEFDRLDVFQRRLDVNQHIVRAETCLRTIHPESTKQAYENLLRVEGTLEGTRFLSNSLYLDTKERLADCDPFDRPTILDLQESLSRLNLLSHVMTRTKKREAHPNAPKREPKVVRVDMTEVERIVYDTVYAFCAERYTRAMGDFAAQFPLITLQRQLASSIPAMLEHYREALEQRSLMDATRDEMDLEEDLANGNGSDDETTGIGNSLVNDAGFVALIKECLTLPLGEQDSKFAQLCKVLRKEKKVIVFSYFRRSLRYLERRLLEEGFSCVRIDGGVPANPQNPDEDERFQRIKRFKEDPEVSVLLSSEVGSEGLDFQFCHTLVNWDLPWNPMVVEQRIGRLDRLGQKSDKILIFNFSIPGTIEDRILNRLYTRVGLFEGAIGPLEPILGQQIKELTEQLFNVNLTLVEQEELVERRARVLEQRLRDEQRLEQESVGLLGHDSFFQEQLERVRRLGRFVTPGEVRQFVADFLANEFPDAVLRTRTEGPRGKDAGEGCEWLRVTAGLRDFVRRALPLNDPALLRFLERAGSSGDVRVTFDNAVAMDDPTVELVQSQHPLVKAVAKFYHEQPDHIHPVSAIEVESDAMPEGDYFFLWAGINESGLQEGRSIWVECLSFDEGTHPTPDQAEQLLHHMVLNGRTWDSLISPTPEVKAELNEMTPRLLDQCEDAIIRRVQRRKAEALEQNRIRVEARIASLQASTDAKRGEKDRLLEHHRLRNNTRIIPLVEAQIRKLEADYEERLRQLQDKKTVGLTYAIEGAGYVRVNAPHITE